MSFLTKMLYMLCLLCKYRQHMKPIISKGHSRAVFWFFHQILFLAFNSRDIGMLWVLNLFSRSSPTKLWKRIFEKMSQKNFFDTQSWHAVNFSHIGCVGNPKFGSEISMKTFFSTKNFYVLYSNAHMFYIT